MNEESILNPSPATSIAWNDFECSFEDSPVTSLQPPVCQSTPIQVEKLSDIESTCSWQLEFAESPLPKKRKVANVLFLDSTNNSEAVASSDLLAFNDCCSYTSRFRYSHIRDDESYVTAHEVDMIDLTPNESTSTEVSQRSSAKNSSSELLGSFCCSNRCLAVLNLLEVETYQRNFQSRTIIEQQQFLLDAIIVTATKSDKNPLHNLTLSGKQLCKFAFLKVLKISEKKLRNVSRLYLQGATIAQPKLRPKKSKSVKHSSAMAWMVVSFL